jgi:hypothetical protein
MSDTQAKRARAQSKLMKRKDKEDRKKVRKEQTTGQPASDVVELDYFMEPGRDDTYGGTPRPPEPKDPRK